MPSARTVTVRPSGGDYTTLRAAITGEASNLVTADEVLTIEIYDEFGGFLAEGTSEISCSGYTTDETRYLIIQAASGDEQTWSESVGARVEGSGSFEQLINSAGRKVIAKNLVLRKNANSFAPVATLFKAESCFIITTSTQAAAGGGLIIESPNGLTDDTGGLYDSIVWSKTQRNVDLVKGDPDEPTTVNNSAIIGGYVDAGTAYEGDSVLNLNDSVIYNTAGTTFLNAGGKTVNADNNAFSDATGVGTNKIVSIATSVFEDYASNDFRTKSGSSLDTAGIGILIAASGNITVDQANLEPGGTISGTYSSFTSTPTSPLTLTDSNSNSITVAVTVTPTDASSGTFTGTMPTLPTSGNTANFLLFGTITVALD